VEDPVSTVRETNGLTEFKQTAPEGNKERAAIEKKLGKERYQQSGAESHKPMVGISAGRS
jgi:hypothetical protein